VSKNRTLIVCLILTSFISFGQEKELITRYRPGVMWFLTGVRPAKLEKVRKYDRLIFDITYNDWIGKQSKPFKNKPTSIGLNVSTMFDVPLVIKNTIAFAWGINYNLFRVDFHDLFFRNSDSNYTSIVKKIEQYGIEKSIFKVHSLAIPLELRFRGKNWKHMKFHVGTKLAYQFMGTTVLSNKIKGITSKQKIIGFYDLNPLQISTHIRFGIRNWAFFANYNLFPFFKSKQSYQINGLQFGLSVSLY
jgi:hypothetical protein